MRLLQRKASRFLGAALVTSLGLAAANVATLSAPAHADPAYSTSFVAVGSDTLQWYFDGLAGGPVGPSATFYTPVSFTSAGTTATITSWDAVSYPSDEVHSAYTFPSAISTKLSGPTFDRPNGSGAGRTALLDEINSTGWYDTNVGTASATGSPVQLGTSLDIARSSSLSGTAGTALVYDPIAQDAVTYAYYCGAGSQDCASIPNLTTTVLTALYASGNSGSLTTAQSGLAHDTLKACTLNTTSGTYGFWATRVGLGSAGAADTNVRATGCGVVSPTQNMEENDLDTFLTSAQAAAGTTQGIDWIAPVSVGQVISQHNGAAPDSSNTALGTTGVGLGVPSDTSTTGITAPFLVSGTTWSPNTPFYQSNWGRFLFAVMNATAINGGRGGAGANAYLQGLFKGATSSVCAPAAGVATQSKFGFDAVSHNGTQTTPSGCGDTTTFIRGA